MKKMMVWISMVVILLLGATGSALAASKYTHEGIYSIPGGGTWRTGKKYSTKKTWSNKAHFKATSMSASLGNVGKLVSSKNKNRSASVSLKVNKSRVAKKNTGSKHYKYKARVRTNKLEWSSSSNIVLGFKAD